MEETLPAREVAVREFNGLRGRLCTVIESAGLPKKQERALVTLVKNHSYQAQAVVAELLDKLDNEDVRFRYTTKLDGPIDGTNEVHGSRIDTGNQVQ